MAPHIIRDRMENKTLFHVYFPVMHVYHKLISQLYNESTILCLLLQLVRIKHRAH
jgi:hypothetical protein